MPGDYVESLRGAKVLVDPDERRARIVHEVEQRGAGGRRQRAHRRRHPRGGQRPDRMAEGDRLQLRARVPRGAAEALIATMETNQKFFPVLDAHGKLSERFIGIANIESKDEAQVRKGYERVIRPRFADAQFFFVEDMKQGLASMADGLASVTYQAKLGTVADKVARVAALAEAIAAAGRRRPGAGAPRRRAVEGRPAVAPGQRVPGAAGHRRPLLRRGRGRAAGGRRRDRRGLHAAVRRRRDRAERSWGRCSRSPNGWIRWPVVSRPG